MPDEEQFSADDLAENVPLDPNLPTPGAPASIDSTPAQRIGEATAKLKEAHATHAQQNTLWRRILFYGVGGLVVVFAAMYVWFIFWYVLSGAKVDPIVLSTWVAGGVAQVIGLLLVITRHLFPGEAAK